MLGRKLILWRTRSRGDRSVVTEEIQVTIVEEKSVPQMWGRGRGTGWRAVSGDGKEFTCNWNSFPDDSPTPTLFWDDKKGNELVDASQARSLGGYVKPKKRPRATA